MTVKEYLLQIELFDMFIESKKKERQDTFKTATAIGSALGREHTRGGSGVSDKIERYALELATLDSEINELNAKREKRIGLIKSLRKPLEVKVLYKRYVEYSKYPSLSAVANEMGYSPQYIVEIHSKALSKLKMPKK